MRDFRAVYVRFGSKADKASCLDYVRFTPKKADIRLTLRHVSFRLGLLPRAARYSLAQWAHLRWTRMLLGRGADNPLLRGGFGFRPVRGCRNHMNDLVAAAFELVENFGQREAAHDPVSAVPPTPW